MAVRERTDAGAEGGSSMEKARRQVEETAGEAREKAASGLQTQVDERSTQAGEQARSFAEALRKTGTQLREEGNDTPARIAEQVASRVERAGEYLERTDGRAMLHDVEDFGRRQPWVVAAGGLVVGLLASRVLKASSERRSAGASPGGRTQAELPPRSGLTQPAGPRGGY